MWTDREFVSVVCTLSSYLFDCNYNSIPNQDLVYINAQGLRRHTPRCLAHNYGYYTLRMKVCVFLACITDRYLGDGRDDEGPGVLVRVVLFRDVPIKVVGKHST